MLIRDFPGVPEVTSLVAQMVKHLPQCRRPGSDLWVRKILWRRKWQPTPVLLPGKSHGQRSVVGCSPWGRKESDMTERLHFTSGVPEVKSLPSNAGDMSLIHGWETKIPHAMGQLE